MGFDWLWCYWLFFHQLRLHGLQDSRVYPFYRILIAYRIVKTQIYRHFGVGRRSRLGLFFLDNHLSGKDNCRDIGRTISGRRAAAVRKNLARIRQPPEPCPEYFRIKPGPLDSRRTEFQGYGFHRGHGSINRKSLAEICRRFIHQGFDFCLAQRERIPRTFLQGI